MKSLMAIVSLFSNAIKFFQTLYQDRWGAKAQWRKKYDLLHKQFSGLRDLHAKALRDGNAVSAHKYYQQWMRVGRSIDAHCATGKQRGYID